MTTTSSTSSTSSTTAAAVSAATTSTTDSASLGSALLTALGGGTGVDMTALATTISTAEYAGQTASINSQLTTVAKQISQAAQLKSDLLSLSSSLATLIDGGGLTPTPTVTNSAVATASLPSGSAGANSSYTLEVTQLAAAQVLASSNYSSSSATMKAGTLTFNFGTIASNKFTAGSTASSTLTVTDGETLTDLASAINNASMGVTAYIATNSSGAQLVLKGTEGAANAFTITSSDTSDSSATGTNSVSTLAYDPATTSTTINSVQGSSDAAYKLDGIARTSTSNTIASAAPGLSLQLTGTNAGNATTITYSDPSSAITTTMTNLVTALNSLVTENNADMASSTGNLMNDQGARAMAKALGKLAGSTIMPNAASGDPATLADLGVTLAKDGSFTLDTSKLASVLSSNKTGVAAMFTKGVHGVYAGIYSMVTALTTSSDTGSLAGSVTRYTNLQTSLNTQLTNIASQQSTLRARLVTQYAAANSSVATYNSTLTYIKDQVAQWNKTS
jgi:flagellar hook-associated protein 2